MQMFDLSVVAWGVATGIAVSAPLGPINFMCIRNTLRHGFWGGVFTGIGSVLGDGLFAVSAALGINFLSDVLTDYERWLLLTGGLLLVAIGIHACISAVEDGDLTAPPGHGRYLAMIATTLALTLTNPFTLAGFLAIFGAAAASLAAFDDQVTILALVGSVMLGSSLWWLALARIVSSFRERLHAAHARLINRAVGAALVLFGTLVLAQLALPVTG